MIPQPFKNTNKYISLQRKKNQACRHKKKHVHIPSKLKRERKKRQTPYLHPTSLIQKSMQIHSPKHLPPRVCLSISLPFNLATIVPLSIPTCSGKQVGHMAPARNRAVRHWLRRGFLGTGSCLHCGHWQVHHEGAGQAQPALQ